MARNFLSFTMQLSISLCQGLELEFPKSSVLAFLDADEACDTREKAFMRQ